MSHGVTYHGGFEVGQTVEVRVLGVWQNIKYRIESFDGLSVFLLAKDGHGIAALVHDIRHPHLAKEVQKRHGSRA